MTNSKELSKRRIIWIREQGYDSYSDQEIRDLAFGNRFAYRLCTAILAVGVAFANIPILILMNIAAASSIFLPNHAFDYIYNHVVRHWINGPKVPPRSIQLKFACTMASCVIASTIYFFQADMMLAGYLMGGHIVIIASLVSLWDYCLPSKMFNYVTGRKLRTQS